MATDAESKEGVVVPIDTSLIIRSTRYYAVIGFGLGLLGVVIMTQFAPWEGIGSMVIGALLSTLVLSSAVLSGPIIAAFVAYVTAGSGFGDVREKSINSGIANGIGFAVLGIIVAVLLAIGISLVSSGGGGGSGGSGGTGGPFGIGKVITLIILMMVPNALVGGGITFILEKDMG